MSDQPDPRFPNIPPEQIGDTLLLPEYCVEVAELLAATENHIDPTVRAIRKIVTQAAVALRTAHQASGLGETPPSESDTHARSQAERLETLGVNASVVRAWATTQGIEVAVGGRLRNEVLTAYEQAHPVAA